MTSKRKLKILTFAEKVDVINAVERSGKKNYEVANEFGIPSSTLSTIMKNKTKIMANYRLLQPGRKKMKPAEYPDLDAGLFEWFVQQQQQQCGDDGSGPVDGPALKRKADALAKLLGHSNFKNSAGWLDKWKKRYNVVLRRANRGGGGGVNTSDVKGRMTYWRHCVSSAVGQYSPDDIFAADQTGVLFECLPGCCGAGRPPAAGRGCCGRHAAGDEGRPCRCRHVTVLLCANMSGVEKMRPLVVGKPRRPRCFRGVKSMPVEYTSDPRARMTAPLWNRWLGVFDERVATENRKIVLFVDDCNANAAASALPRLRAITVRFLPAYDVSSPKPLGPAVIRDFKTFYRTEVVRKIIASWSSGQTFSTDLLRTTRMIDKAWRQVTSQTVANCFRSAGFWLSPSVGAGAGSDYALGAAVQTNPPLSPPLAPQREPDRQSLDPAEWFQVTTRLDLKPEDTFSSYVEIDEHLSICCGGVAGDPTDSEILLQATGLSSNDTSDSDDSDECCTSKKITLDEASKALDVLRDFIESTEGMNKSHFEALGTIEDTMDEIKYTETQRLMNKKKMVTKRNSM